MATMQLLLREDVENLGKRGDIVRVRAGYARNYLLPRKLAIVATSQNVKVIHQERQLLARRETREQEAARSLAERLGDVTLEFVRKASDQQVFYGSVSAQDIAEALADRGLEVERRRIHLDAPIKQAGSYRATVKLHRDVVVELPITATAEGAPVASEEEVAAPVPEPIVASEELVSEPVPVEKKPRSRTRKKTAAEPEKEAEAAE